MIKENYHHGNLKEELLKLTFKYISKNDVNTLTLKMLAEQTGTSRSSIYRHFSSKDDLIQEIIEIGFELFDNEVIKTINDKNISLLDRFYLAGKYYITWAINNPNLYKLLFGKEYSNIRESIISIKNDECKSFYEFKNLIKKGQRLGIIKKDDPYKQTIIAWSSIHGLCTLIIDGFMDIHEIYIDLYNDIFQSLLNGLISNKIKIISSLPFQKKLLLPSSKYNIKQVI